MKMIKKPVKTETSNETQKNLIEEDAPSKVTLKSFCESKGLKKYQMAGFRFLVKKAKLGSDDTIFYNLNDLEKVYIKYAGR